MQAPKMPINMGANQKRKRQWSSKGLFGLKTVSKIFVIEQLPSTLDNVSHDADMCSAENAHEKSGTAAKLRRTGSKLLSVVRFSGSSGA